VKPCLMSVCRGTFLLERKWWARTCSLARVYSPGPSLLFCPFLSSSPSTARITQT
jgi:hypothetical protein